jgi:hypothetical protein
MVRIPPGTPNVVIVQLISIVYVLKKKTNNYFAVSSNNIKH